MEWHGFIADGHNRYSICKEHNIEYVVGTLGYETKDEVMEWMLDIQLGRRNLSPIQRIAVAEKYRPIYEKQARENQGKRTDLVVNLPQSKNNEEESKLGRTSEKLSQIAGVSEKTYRMGAKVLNSDNEELKKEVLSGEKSISAAYKDLTSPQVESETENNKVGIDNSPIQSNKKSMMM